MGFKFFLSCFLFICLCYYVLVCFSLYIVPKISLEICLEVELLVKWYDYFKSFFKAVASTHIPTISMWVSTAPHSSRLNAVRLFILQYYLVSPHRICSGVRYREHFQNKGMHQHNLINIKIFLNSHSLFYVILCLSFVSCLSTLFPFLCIPVIILYFIIIYFNILYKHTSSFIIIPIQNLPSYSFPL